MCSLEFLSGKGCTWLEERLDWLGPRAALKATAQCTRSCCFLHRGEGVCLWTVWSSSRFSVLLSCARAPLKFAPPPCSALRPTGRPAPAICFLRGTSNGKPWQECREGERWWGGEMSRTASRSFSGSGSILGSICMSSQAPAPKGMAYWGFSFQSFTVQHHDHYHV